MPEKYEGLKSKAARLRFVCPVRSGPKGFDLQSYPALTRSMNPPCFQSIVDPGCVPLDGSRDNLEPG